MINYNQNFADALCDVLEAAGMTRIEIETAIGGELKEVDIAETYSVVVIGIGNGGNLRADLIQEVTRVGGAVAGNVWNLTPTNINGGLRLSATEELGAICRYGGTPTFDAAKAVTNLLRLIKAARRF